MARLSSRKTAKNKPNGPGCRNTALPPAVSMSRNMRQAMSRMDASAANTTRLTCKEPGEAGIRPQRDEIERDQALPNQRQACQDFLRFHDIPALEYQDGLTAVLAEIRLADDACLRQLPDL